MRLALAEVFTDNGSKTAIAVYKFFVGTDALAVVSKITKGLSGDQSIRVVPDAADEIRQGLQRTINRGLSVQLINSVDTPVFTLNNPPPMLSVCPTKIYDSEIAAKIMRVGGAKPVARVRLLGSQQDATLTLSGQRAARELGNHLYRDAVLHGQGEWVIDQKQFSRPTRLLNFRVATYRLLPDASAERVIDAMTNASGGIWDQADPTDSNQLL